jgi:cysteine desulfurase
MAHKAEPPVSLDPPVYLDHAASTPMRVEAVAAMLPFLTDRFANSTGAHAAARVAKDALEEARETVARELGAAPGEVVFTGSGTEADNLGVVGAARAARHMGGRAGVVTCRFEHKAVLASADRLEREGFAVRRVPATRDGVVDLEALADALADDTAVVSIMLVNNEIGTIQPLDAVAALVRERAPAAVLHTDAVQAVPWLDVSVAAAGASLLSISAHKFGGPKGMGALVVRDGVTIQPIVEGGGQERGRRAGTADVPSAVAMATALALTARDRTVEVARVGALRDRLRDGLFATVDDVVDTARGAAKVAGSCHLAFRGVDAELLVVALDRAGVCASAGSSCSSGATQSSHVLDAMGLPPDEQRGSVRFSLGATSDDTDVERALAVIPGVVASLRERAEVTGR